MSPSTSWSGPRADYDLNELLSEADARVLLGEREGGAAMHTASRRVRLVLLVVGLLGGAVIDSLLKG